MRHFSWMMILVCGVSVLFLAAGCGQKVQKKRIGVSIPAATHGWAGGVVWCAEQAKKELEKAHPDLEVLLVTSSDSAGQADRIENLLVRKVDAVVVMAQEPGPITPVCEQVKKQGKFLVVVSNRLDRPVQDVFINGDNSSFGREAGRAMGQLLRGTGKIVVMEGIPCPVNTERITAFREILKKDFPGIEILESQSAWWNTEKGLALMENYLQKYPRIDGVWTGDDDVLVGALRAYEESGRKDVKAFVGGGGSKHAVKQVADGHPLVKATVTYTPAIISKAIRLAADRLYGPENAVFDKEMIVPSVIVTGQNAAEHYHPDSVY